MCRVVEEERVQRHARDDPGQRDRQDHHERDELAAEEREAVDGERRSRPEQHRRAHRDQRHADGEPQRVPHLLRVPRDAEPVRRKARDRPALHVRLVERVDHDDRERHVEEREHERDPHAQPDPGARRLH